MRAGEVELQLMSEALTLGLKSASTNMRNQWEGLLKRLMQRSIASLRAGVAKRKAFSEGSNEAGPSTYLSQSCHILLSPCLPLKLLKMRLRAAFEHMLQVAKRRESTLLG